MPHRNDRRASASITDVVIGCISVVLVIAIGTLFSTSDGAADSPISPAVASANELVTRNDWEALLADAPAPASANEPPTYTKLTPEDLYERVAPSVVTLIVQDEDGEAIGSGSGFLIDEAALFDRYDSLDIEKQLVKSRADEGTPTQYGYVLTNYHVIRPAVSAHIVLSNGDKGMILHVIGEDENADLALLFVFYSSQQPLKGIPVAPENPRVLTTVYAIGSPKGLSGSASEGKVSGFRELLAGEEWLQTTAPISPGSSGGPLLLADGTLAGVTTMFLEDAQNLNFAISVAAVRTFLKTTKFERRDIAEGASIKWHEDAAFDVMKSLVESDIIKCNDDERHAVALLQKARYEVTDVRGIEMAGEAVKSVPDEFKYLAHYVAGQASRWAAIKAIHATKRNHEFAHGEFGARYRSSNHANVALHHLTETMRLMPEFAPAFHELVTHYELRGDRTNALLAANSLVDKVPRCANALNIRARCYSELNQLESAKNDLESAIELSPKDLVFYGKLADVLVELGHYAEAISLFEKAIELEELDVFKDGYYFDMGIAYYKAGNFEKAISAFTQAKNMGYPAEECDPIIAECIRRQR